MKCLNCQFDNPEAAKFCIECGCPIEFHCPQCEATTPSTGNFCMECGHENRPAILLFSPERFRSLRFAGFPVLPVDEDGETFLLPCCEPLALDGVFVPAPPSAITSPLSSESEKSLDRESSSQLELVVSEVCSLDFSEELVELSDSSDISG